MRLADIAAATGFASERRLRSAIQRTFRRAPSALRGAAGAGATSSLRIPARAPFDATPLLAFFGARAIPGVEQVEGRTYRRTIVLDGVPSTLEVEAPDGESGVRLRVTGASPRHLLPLVARVTRLFDLDADAAAIAAHLRKDARLRRAVPIAGVRVPGAWEPFELGVRALLGQQVSVAAARTLAGRLVAACGAPLPNAAGALTHVFPTPATVAAAPLERLGLTRARAAALRTFARAVADGSLDLSAPGELDDAVARLTALPGIGDWTAQYIALRALREPDAFPAGDLAVRKALATEAKLPNERYVIEQAESWRPWRAYATLAIWGHEPAPTRHAKRKERART
jgi:AraC family transcriptional regulator of adaptative response / DNA-3-methyladenine glycosylase II